MSVLAQRDYFNVFIVPTQDPGNCRRARRSRVQLEDTGWLRHEYEVNGRSSSEIAAELDVTPKTVQNALRGAGIEVRRRGRPSATRGITRAWLHREYVRRGRPAADIARDLHVSEDVVLSLLHRNGVPVRPRGGGQRRSAAELPKELRDRTWLGANYLEQGKSVRAIAVELGVSGRAVWTALRRAGVERRR